MSRSAPFIYKLVPAASWRQAEVLGRFIGSPADLADGYIHFVGRGDDVFKSSDYRISPFELESALVEHPMVAEAAVIPSPDPLRLAVPKAFVVLCAGVEPSAETAAVPVSGW